MIQNLLDEEHKQLEYFFRNLDVSAFEKLFKDIAACKGMIICTGVGKSGFIAKKIAATMISTNTRAFFLSPVDALHGDIGIATQGDMCLLFSKSGESEELLSLMPSLRNKGVKTIAIVSNPASRLAKTADAFMHLPLEKELCPFDLAPTTSCLIQLIFGDILAIALMNLNKFSVEDMALNHPAGRIGKRTSFRVKDLMIKGDNLPLATQEKKIVDILVELSNKRCGCILIKNEQGKLLGIFTDGDLRRSLQKEGSKALENTLQNLMTRSPRKIGPNAMAVEAIKIMEGSGNNEVSVLPVLEDDGTLVGLVKLHDLIQTGL